MVELGIHTQSGLSPSSDMMSSLNISYYLLKFTCLSRCLASLQSLLKINQAVLTWQQTEIQGNTLGDVVGLSSEWGSSHVHRELNTARLRW